MADQTPAFDLDLLRQGLGLPDDASEDDVMAVLRRLVAGAQVAGSFPGAVGPLQTVSPGLFSRDAGFRSFLDPSAITRNLGGLQEFAPTGVPFLGGSLTDPEPAATAAAVGALLGNLSEAIRVGRERRRENGDQ